MEQYKLKGLGDIDKIAHDITAASGFGDFCLEPYNVASESIYEIINDIEMLIHKCSGFEYQLFDLVKIYFSMSLKCGVNLHSLFECYIGKNVLNKFRQDNGYKDGSYIKIWNGKEDNIVMSEILASGVSGIDEIYEALQIEYKKAK